MAELIGETDKPNVAGVTAINTNSTDSAGVGLHARSKAAAVVGESTTWMGVFGLSESTTGGHGVMGRAVKGGAGVVGESTSTGAGVIGDNVSQGDDAGFGVLGRSRGAGVVGESKTWMGVFGHSESTTGGHGVMGRAVAGGAGVAGEATKGIGVFGSTESGEAAVRGDHKGGGFAGVFNGNVLVTQVLTVKGSVDITGNLLVQGQALDATSLREVAALAQRLAALEQRVAAVQEQVNTAVSALTSRVTKLEFQAVGLANISHTHT